MILSDLFQLPYDHEKWNADQKTLADRLEQQAILPAMIESLRDFHSSNVASLLHAEYVKGYLTAYCQQHNIEIT